MENKEKENVSDKPKYCLSDLMKIKTDNKILEKITKELEVSKVPGISKELLFEKLFARIKLNLCEVQKAT